MSKHRAIGLLTEPFLGWTRRRIDQLRAQMFNSTGVRLAQLWYRRLQQNTSQVTDAPLSTDELAYLLPTLRGLVTDPALIRANRMALLDLGVPLFACLYWRDSISVQIRTPLPLRSHAFRIWWESHGPSHYKEADRLLEEASSIISALPRFQERPFGVNLVGHAFNVFGLGEYMRMIARALDAASVPYCVIDCPSFNGASDQDRSLEGKLIPVEQSSPYPFNLFCMAADTQMELAIKQGLHPSSHTYTIACWFWEMDKWPQPLMPALDLADEHWPCTRIIETALRSAQAGRSFTIFPIPPVVELAGLPSPRQLAARRHEQRHAHGLDSESVLFVFSFDLNSSIARKNPQAVLRAFQQAFGAGSGGEAGVGLVIKTFPPRKPSPLWDALKDTAAADPRITILEADLDRAALLALYGCCDVFVSLHRSEGLGLGPAEALQLGLDVIATDYGGNTDFCNGPLAHPVPYRLIPVQAGEYAHHEGMVWADPDVEQAAVLMQEVAEKRRREPLPDPAVVQAYRERFSAARVGALYRQRLEALWADRARIQAELDSRYGGGPTPSEATAAPTPPVAPPDHSR